jgi:hypothetical protein
MAPLPVYDVSVDELRVALSWCIPELELKPVQVRDCFAARIATWRQRRNDSNLDLRFSFVLTDSRFGIVPPCSTDRAEEATRLLIHTRAGF